MPQTLRTRITHITTGKRHLVFELIYRESGEYARYAYMQGEWYTDRPDSALGTKCDNPLLYSMYDAMYM